MKVLKVFGYLILVILLLLVVAPWIFNVLSVDAIAQTYDAYVEWVNDLFK